LTQGFRILSDGADVVLGPCDDGGYYLIGIKKPAPRLLREVHMSTSTVAVETMALAKEEGLQLVTVPVWYDVDDVVSLLRLMEEVEKPGSDKAIHTRRFLRMNQIQELVSDGVED
jgi:glycosyltransferase A (GT-A) superfamily protein (DUF2064 family)